MAREKQSEAFAHFVLRPRLDGAAGHEGEPGLVPIHDAPAHIAKARVQTEDTRDGVGHEAGTAFEE